MSITEAIDYLTLTGYPLNEAVRLTFMSKWNKKNNKRLLTLPLFIHKIFFVKYGEGEMVDVHTVNTMYQLIRLNKKSLI